MNTDQELISSILRGHRKSGRMLIERYYPKVLAFLLRMVRDKPLAEDLCQEAFIRVHEKLSLFNPERPFLPWILKVTYHVTLGYLRRKQPQTVGSALLDEIPASGERSPGQVDDRLLLDECLGRIPQEERLVFLLKITLDLTYEEIAGIIEKPVGSVKTIVHQTRIALRKALSLQTAEPNSNIMQKES